MNHERFSVSSVVNDFGCKKAYEQEPETAEPRLIFRIALDPDQERLDNLGNTSTIPDGHAAQSPDFNQVSAHYIEMIPNALTALGAGEIVYEGIETNAGGDAAIDFDQARLVGADQEFFSLPLSQVESGNYEYVRVSVSYQNFDIDFLTDFGMLEGTLASFVGFNTYITDYTISEETVNVFENKLQGYWGFETIGQTFTGQAPEGATTVPNPIQSSSPIPPGSCLVTGAFTTPLTITGNETDDVIVTLSLSINNSFEWEEVNEDGLYEPDADETVVDMGLRGLMASWE